jgi:hypothetical protein
MFKVYIFQVSPIHPPLGDFQCLATLPERWARWCDSGLVAAHVNMGWYSWLSYLAQRAINTNVETLACGFVQEYFVKAS